MECLNVDQALLAAEKPAKEANEGAPLMVFPIVLTHESRL